jgi:thiol:disulfide interchange protein DsbA
MKPTLYQQRGLKHGEINFEGGSMTKWLIMVIISMLSVGSMAQDQFIEGQHYQLIKKPVRTADQSKIEVTEVFWYGCPHCNTFSPVFEQWSRQQDSTVYTEHSPAMWNKSMEVHARLFYTAKTLGKLDEMHTEIFAAMHIQGQRLLKESEIYDLFKKHNVSKEQFNKVFSSFGVNSLVQQADARARSYGITGTPEVIVNGKYRTSGRMAGSSENVLKVIDYLVEKEKAFKS